MPRYQLDCVACGFSTVVAGASDEVLDVAETHQDDHRTSSQQHFVEIEVRDERTIAPL